MKRVFKKNNNTILICTIDRILVGFSDNEIMKIHYNNYEKIDITIGCTFDS